MILTMQTNQIVWKKSWKLKGSKIIFLNFKKSFQTLKSKLKIVMIP